MLLPKEKSVPTPKEISKHKNNKNTTINAHELDRGSKEWCYPTLSKSLPTALCALCVWSPQWLSSVWKSSSSSPPSSTSSLSSSCEGGWGVGDWHKYLRCATGRYRLHTLVRWSAQVPETPKLQCQELIVSSAASQFYNSLDQSRFSLDH